MPSINQVTYGSVLEIKFLDGSFGFGIVKSVDIDHQKVTFSKLDTLKDGNWLGVIEDVTIHYLSDRISTTVPMRYFQLCDYYNLNANLKCSDFFKQGDVIYTGIQTVSGTILGRLDEIEERPRFRHELWLVDSAIYDGISLQKYNSNLFPPINIVDRNQFPVPNEDDMGRISVYLGSNVKIFNRADWFIEKLEFLNTYKDYSIRGNII